MAEDDRPLLTFVERVGGRHHADVVVDAQALGSRGQGHREERVGDRRELDRGDVEGGSLVGQGAGADDDRSDADVVLDRPTRPDADDRADADLDEFVDDDAHRRGTHPARRTHDRRPAGQRGGKGVEPPVS